MKQILLLLLLATGIADAQIVNIPDANFKSKLLEASADNGIAYGNGVRIKIDANDDGNIQLIEAQAVDSLNVSFATVNNLTGISSFNNLKKLECFGNQLNPSLDLSALTQLTSLDCSQCELNSLNISGLTQLRLLAYSINSLPNLNVSFLPNLEELYNSNNDITSLDLSGFSNLKKLNCGGNLITQLNLTGCTNLKTLEFGGNDITSVDLSSLINVESVSCSVTALTQLDLSNCLHLSSLFVNYTPLTNLNIANLPELYWVDVRSNQITEVDVSGCSSLYSLNIDSNQVNSINLSGCTNLEEFYGSSNQFEIIDFTDCHHLYYTEVAANPNLRRIFAKNGSNEELGFNLNPALEYICADETQLETVQTALDNLGYSSTAANSYCFYAFGGDFNLLTGSARLDMNNNGCNSNDIPLPTTKINVTGDGHEGANFVNASGQYYFYTGTGNFTLTPQIENPTFFNVSPTTATVNFSDTGVTGGQDFCVTANGIHHDVDVTIVPFPARSGFDANYQLIYKNKGNQVESGTVTFVFEDDVLDVVSSEPVADTQNTNALAFNYTNLLPFETRIVNVTMNLNSPQEIPALNIDDILDFSASITSGDIDEMPLDNQMIIAQTVVGAFDPNNKICIEGNSVDPIKIGDYLHYVINFENTGTAPAVKVVVKDIIDTDKFDVSSLQFLSASHPAQIRILDNRVEFFIENINLAPNAHGNVVFKIKTKSNLVVGNSVSNKADIYFDYNFPVVTDPAVTVFSALARSEFKVDDSVSIVPNPATDRVTITADHTIQSVRLCDAQGRCLLTQVLQEKETRFNLSGYPNAVYFVSVTTSQGSTTAKVIKQ